MSALMPELQQALMAAARRRAAPSRRHRVSRRTGLLVLAALVAGSSATAATLWQPQLGDGERGPTVAAAGAPPEQAAALGVLRREQTAADRGTHVQSALKLLARSEDDGVHVEGVRLLADHPDGALVLVPMQRVGRDDPGYPSSIRRDVLCVLHYTDAVGAAKSCGTVADLRSGRISGSASRSAAPVNTQGQSASGFASLHMRFYQLVPDGVARVEMTLREGSPHVVVVHDNAVELSLPPGIVSVSSTRWLDATGHEVGKDR